MSRISNVFAGNRKALIPYITVGYPSPDITLKTVPLLARLGCDIIELGIPFSDPLADGATIQKASFAALHNGINPTVCLDMVKQIRTKTDVPLVFMSYYNPIYNYGLDKFVTACIAVGIDGLIIPDLPPDEGEELEQLVRGRGLDLIYLLAPTSTDERIQLVSEHSNGFIYLVSVAGVTGTRQNLPEGLEAFVQRVRNRSRHPLCVGFGVSTPDQAREISQYADGVIVGSRLVQIMENPDWEKQMERFIVDLKTAINRR
jgi:tryptophan synthase alpha chain